MVFCCRRKNHHQIIIDPNDFFNIFVIIHFIVIAYAANNAFYGSMEFNSNEVAVYSILFDVVTSYFMFHLLFSLTDEFHNSTAGEQPGPAPLHLGQGQRALEGMDTVCWSPDSSQTQDVSVTIIACVVTCQLSLSSLCSALRGPADTERVTPLRALCAPRARVKDIARDQLSSGATHWDTARVKITKYTRHEIIRSVLLFDVCIIWKAIVFKH